MSRLGLMERFLPARHCPRPVCAGKSPPSWSLEFGGFVSTGRLDGAEATGGKEVEWHAVPLPPPDFTVAPSG